MITEKHYMAEYDEGTYFGRFDFWSVHKAGSKANHEDAIARYKSLHGYRAAKRIEILRIHRIPDDMA